MRTVSVLGATVWLALAVGLLECGILAVRKFALHEFLNRSPDVWWLAPTAYLALFLPAGLGLALLARWRPGWPAVPMTVLLLGWTGLTALLLLVVRQKLHPAAVLLLGLGVAAQAARLVRTRPAGFAGLVRRTTPAMALLVLALAAGLTGGRWWRERRAVAALPPAPA
ncbi:MAG TPA: hypothetical protein VNK43_08275, partial [Gemmatimonadales bacterium]|nr:hypothetical protein [Gemmatimonadales bacterium]